MSFKSVLTIGSILVLTLYGGVALADDRPEPAVQANGMAEIKAVPDEAEAVFVVEQNSKELEKAQKETNKTIEALIRFAASKLMVKEKDIQTEVFQIRPVYEQRPCAGQSQRQCATGTLDYYNVRKGVSIHVRDLSVLQKLLDESVRLGVTQIDSITFLTSKQKELEAQARKEAAKDAEMKAKDVAGVLGVALGKPFMVTINQSAPVFYRKTATEGRMMAMAASADSMGGGDAIAAGEITITANVYVQFRIKE